MVRQVPSRVWILGYSILSSLRSVTIWLVFLSAVPNDQFVSTAEATLAFAAFEPARAHEFARFAIGVLTHGKAKALSDAVIANRSGR